MEHLTRTREQVTYEQISQILAKLGFVRTDTAEYIAFRNADYDSLLALPLNPPEQWVDAAHLAAVRATVTGSGVASETTFARMLALSATDANAFADTLSQHSEAA